MNRWIFIIVLAVFGSGAAFSALEEKQTYYAQLIRGNDEDQPPISGAKAIGPKLSKSLKSVFRWKHYGEISGREVSMDAGAKAKVVLSQERRLS